MSIGCSSTIYFMLSQKRFPYSMIFSISVVDQIKANKEESVESVEYYDDETPEESLHPQPSQVTSTCDKLFITSTNNI